MLCKHVEKGNQEGLARSSTASCERKWIIKKYVRVGKSKCGDVKIMLMEGKASIKAPSAIQRVQRTRIWGFEGFLVDSTFCFIHSKLHQPIHLRIEASKAWIRPVICALTHSSRFINFRRVRLTLHATQNPVWFTTSLQLPLSIIAIVARRVLLLVPSMCLWFVSIFHNFLSISLHRAPFYEWSSPCKKKPHKRTRSSGAETTNGNSLRSFFCSALNIWRKFVRNSEGSESKPMSMKGNQQVCITSLTLNVNLGTAMAQEKKRQIIPFEGFFPDASKFSMIHRRYFWTFRFSVSHWPLRIIFVINGKQ